MGEYDGTALMEFKTRKEIIYLLNNETVCTYEMDDAPPFEMNDEALDRALAVTMMLGCNVVGEVHITRKQYLDGSIPTGFQRTAIVGTDGDIPFAGRTVHIRQLVDRGGQLPRGQRQRPRPHLPHRPPGHAPDRDRHRPGHGHARRRPCRWARCCAGWPAPAAWCAPGRAPRART